MEPFMAIGDECCLGVSNEEVTRRTTESVLGYEIGDSSLDGVGGGLHWEEPAICALRRCTEEASTQVLASKNDEPQSDTSFVTGSCKGSFTHAGSEKQSQNCSASEGEPMCASGILCSGVRPCSMPDFVLPVTDSSTDGPEPSSVAVDDATKIVEEKIDVDNNAAVDKELENGDSAQPTQAVSAITSVEEMEIDDKEPNNSESQEKMEEDERSISPDEEGSKCSQSSDNGYASDSSNSDASDNELTRAKSAGDEDSSSSSEDESSPDDSPSPPSADESSPFPCVEEVETRTGISFERTLSNNSQSDSMSSFSFSSPSAGGLLSVAPSGVGASSNVNEASCARVQLRSRVMSLLDGGVRLIDDSERCLRRYVLLKTNLNRLRKEVRDERLGVHRRRRHQALAQGFAEALAAGGGLTRSSLTPSGSPGYPYEVPNTASPMAGQVSSSPRSASGSPTTTCTVSSSASGSRPLAADGDEQEPALKRPRYATEENKENHGGSGSLFLTSMQHYTSEASGFYGSSSGHYTPVCSNSSGGYYSTSSQSLYCMNHLSNHYSSSSTNYFNNSSHFATGSTTPFMGSFSCSGSQTNNDRINVSSGSNNGSNSISGGNSSNASGASYSSSCALDSFTPSATSGSGACGASGAPDSNSNANNGGFYNVSNVTSSSCSGVGLRSNLETIIEAIDQQILRGSYGAGTSKPLTSGAHHTSPFGSFASYSTGNFFESRAANQSGSHIFSNSEGSSYHIFGNNRHGASNSAFGDTSGSNYSMGHSSASYNTSFSSCSSPYSESSSSLAPQNPCGRSQLPGNDFQSLVYSSLMASLES